MPALDNSKNTTNQHASQQAALLVREHTLSKADHDTRLVYLAALTLTCASDREIHTVEKLAYLDIAQSMSIDVQEAEEQLHERDSTSEDDMIVMFADIRKQQLAWRFLLDVAWIHAADETIETAEVDALKDVAELLEIDSIVVLSLHELALARRKNKFSGVVKAMQAIPENSGLHELLPELLSFQKYEVVNIKTGFNIPGRYSKVEIEWKSKIGDSISVENVIAILKEPSDVMNTLYLTANKIEPVQRNITTRCGGVIASINFKEGARINISTEQIVGTLYRTNSVD